MPKIVFFGFIEKCGHQSFLNLFYNENQYYLLCSCTNSIFGKNLVPEMWVKMLPANLIAGLLNQFYLQDKPMKQPDFLHFDTNSQKQKLVNFLGVAMVKNGCNQSGNRTLKLIVSQE